jgi:HPt (histidine-containing phosphotransfer) domain-containing protein
MNKDSTNKLKALRNAYAQKIPSKISEIKNLFITIQKDPSTENLTLLQRLAHNLHGSAATFGFTSLSQAAKDIENHISSSPQDLSHLQQLIATLDSIKL